MLQDSRIDRLSALLLGVCAAAVSLSTIVMAFPGVMPLPLFDDWVQLDPGKLVHRLFAPHGDHRIVTTKLASLVDMRFFHGSHVGFFCISAFFLLALGGIYWMAARLSPASTPARRTIAASIVICLGISPLTVGVLLWAMHVGNAAVNFFAPLAFGLLALCWTEQGSNGMRHYARLSAALVLAACATLSAANGAPAPLLLLAQAAVMGFRKRDLGILAIGAALTGGVFLRGGRAQGDALTTLLTAPFDAIKFFFVFLGSIVPQAATLSDAVQYELLAFLLGLVSVALLIVNTLVYARRYRAGSREGFALFSVVCNFFFLIAAGLVSLGRLPLGMSYSYTEHYNLLRVLYWANLLVSIPACWGTARSWHVASALGLCGGLMMARLLPMRAEGLVYRRLSLNVASAAMMAEVFDLETWKRSHSWNLNAVNEEFETVQRASLRQRELSLFHEPAAKWLGQDTKTLPFVEHSCVGSILTSRHGVDPHGPYTVVTGWVRTTKESDKIPQLVLADRSGQVTGYGAIGARNTVAQWTGYSRSAEPPSDAYLVEEGRLCRLLGSPGTAQVKSLLQNPSFEDAGDWTFHVPPKFFTGRITNGSEYGNPPAPDGATAVALQQLGSFSQTVEGLRPGTSYQLSFYAAGRGACSGCGGDQTIEICVDGVVATTVRLASGQPYKQYTVSFQTARQNILLLLRGTATTDQTAFIDNLSLVEATGGGK